MEQMTNRNLAETVLREDGAMVEAFLGDMYPDGSRTDRVLDEACRYSLIRRMW